MLGSNPVRDNRLRRRHAEGGSLLLKTIFPRFIMTLPFMPLKNP